MAEGLLRRSALLVTLPFVAHACANALAVVSVSSLGMQPVVAVVNWIVLAVLVWMTRRLAAPSDGGAIVRRSGAAAARDDMGET
ncbi:hypothetical protein [Salinarimonas chemoclinalis]|uniref:hypothetical protein n=1 Tax=Salinarimonas chemoclinalis TaxID=3241599 RepID=UPI0035572D8B